VVVVGVVAGRRTAPRLGLAKAGPAAAAHPPGRSPLSPLAWSAQKEAVPALLRARKAQALHKAHAHHRALLRARKAQALHKAHAHHRAQALLKAHPPRSQAQDHHNLHVQGTFALPGLRVR
jgi:hypothetical protein